MATGGALEIEAKFRVADFTSVHSGLSAAGAARVGRVVETNRFFDRPDHSLRQAGCGLRLRSIRPLDGPARSATLTFKGPLLPGPLKTRPECEIAVNEADRAAELLRHLGFVETLTFEKVRESWRLGRCSVELDVLPLIGRFVEIEGPDEKEIDSARGILGLADARIERDSYLGLLVQRCREGGADLTRLRLPPEAVHG